MEIFKPIKGYEGLYEISNYGNIKSLSREISNGKNKYYTKERILKQNISKDGYRRFTLYLYGKMKNYKTHVLMAINFLNHIPCRHKVVVDHIDNNKLNNNLLNLQLITNRENCTKDMRKNKTSSYVGVSKCNFTNKWLSVIQYQGKYMNLGRYNTQEEANEVRLKFIKENNIL